MYGASMEDAEDTNTDSTHCARVEQARSQHLAFRSYLEAFRVVEGWREGVAGTGATTSLVADGKLDKTHLNTNEMAMALSTEFRGVV
jgi:hypothetical protein